SLERTCGAPRDQTAAEQGLRRSERLVVEALALSFLQRRRRRWTTALSGTASPAGDGLSQRRLSLECASFVPGTVAIPSDRHGHLPACASDPSGHDRQTRA